MTNRQLMESAARGIVGDAMTRAVMEAYEVCFEADGKQRKSYESLRKMAIRLLAEANSFNVMHWNADSMNRHNLLQEMYELCRDTGDSMAETYMSLTEKPCMPASDSELHAGSQGPDDALDSMVALKDDMNAVVAANPGFTEGVKNLFADFDEKATSIIYKYRQFKA